MARVDLTDFKAWAVAYCEGCNRYIARVRRPPSYGFILKYHALGCTIILTDDLAMAGKRLQPCVCKNR